VLHRGELDDLRRHSVPLLALFVHDSTSFENTVLSLLDVLDGGDRDTQLYLKMWRRRP
jgi:hypothetical protein